MTVTRWPESVDLFMPLLDGFVPIDANDLNVYQQVLTRLQEVLGYGSTGTGTLGGPRGSNGSLAERLNRFLATDGGLHDIAFVTGTLNLAAFKHLDAGQNRAGAFIGFGKSLSRAGNGPDSYHVLFIPMSNTTEGTPARYSDNTPACWWVVNKRLDGVFITADVLNGGDLQPGQSNDDRPIQFGLLAIGYEAYSTGT